MPNKSETPANVEDVGQPKREASLAAPNGYTHRNCNNCVHRDGGMCVLTGYHWAIQRKYPEAPCDINLSGWQPLPPKKPLMQRIRELWGSGHTDQAH